MMKLVIPILFSVAAMILMAAALHFSKYRKRASGCCGGGTCELPAVQTDAAPAADHCEKHNGAFCEAHEADGCVCPDE